MIVSPLPFAARRLAAGQDFLDVAMAVCSLGKDLFGLDSCTIWLHTANGRPLLSVDAFEGLPDELRLGYFAERWVLDPFLAIMREQHAPVGDEIMGMPRCMQLARELGYRGPPVYTLSLPLLEPAGLIGQIRCGRTLAYSPELRRDLTALATHVSVRLSQLGVTSIHESGNLAKLTVRQVDVAHLAARGRTNLEIATALRISENTVKKHLKEIYDRVGVASRTELAVLLSRVAPPVDVPIGISRRDGFTITRAAPSPSVGDEVLPPRQVVLEPR